jgi:tetratricopeptide (TPR) repeat protein
MLTLNPTKPSLWCFLPFLVAMSFLQARSDDTVRLKDASSQAGQVVELGGNSIEILAQGGSKKILKGQIETVTFDENRRSQQTEETDVVIRKGGHRVRGTVEILQGGTKVQVTMPGGSKAVFDRSTVERILRRGEVVEVETTVYTQELGKKIDDVISKLLGSAGGPESSLVESESFLESCGIFAIAKVREALKKADPSAEGAKALARVDRLYRLKETAATELEEVESRIYEVLSRGSRKEKCDLLVLIFPRFVEECSPLVKLLAIDPSEDPVVRAWCIDFLRRMNKNRELLDIYRRSTGQIQLATAIALGRNRILIGVPTFLEAMEFESEEIRAIAGKNLQELTSKDFGYRAQGAPQARAEAIAKWKAWWQENEEGFKNSSENVLKEKSEETDERKAAVELWKEASRDLEAKDAKAAEAHLRRALETDPSYYPASICLGILLYTDLGRPQEAVKLFSDLKTTRLPGVSGKDRQWLFLHLGQSLQLTGDLQEAIGAYQQATVLAPDNLQATVGLGNALFARATSESDSSPEERKKDLVAALDAFDKALSLIESLGENLTVLRVSDLPSQIELSFDRREYNRSVLGLREKYELQRHEVLYRKGKIKALLGETKEALLALRTTADEVAVLKTEEARKLEGAVRSYLGLLYEELGEFSLAHREYRRVIDKLDPQNKDCQQGIDRIKRRMSTGRGDRNEAGDRKEEGVR